jgi:hypothetical protein
VPVDQVSLRVSKTPDAWAIFLHLEKNMGINTKMHKINKFPIKTLLNKSA